MGIARKSYYRGAALSGIVDRGEFTALPSLSDIGSGAYLVNHNIGLFIKHTEKTGSPWVFGFHPEHQSAIRDLFGKYKDRTFIICVCPPDGICVLTYGEYAAVLDENFRAQENL